MRRGLITAAAAVSLTVLAWYPAAASAATSWTAQVVPVPAGTQNGSLAAVSCFPANSCMAVGYSQTGSADEMQLAESWNGSTWTIQNITNPPGTVASSLAGVSCTSASSCIAVGGADTTNGNVLLAQQWNGSTWSLTDLPSPAGMTSVLHGISCTSASSCIAVGVSSNSSNVIFTLAEQWNGSTWTVLTTANQPSQFGNSLAAVSCTSASSCMATGLYYNGPAEVPLAEQWDGSTWTITPALATGGAQDLGSVSCTSAANCTAVGQAEPSVLEPLAEHWNGSTWTIQKVPPFAGSAGGSWLNGVSCTTAAHCTAVGGGYRKKASVNALSYNWNGKSWTAQPTASPAAAKLLNSVSCTSVTTCTAAGNSVTPPGNGVHLPLAETRA